MSEMRTKPNATTTISIASCTILIIAFIASLTHARHAHKYSPVTYKDQIDCPKVERNLLDDRLCKASLCRRNTDCRNGSLCCNNGCIQTCLGPIQAQVFDWVEETPEKARKGPEALEFIETMIFRGCHITKKQLMTLNSFEESNHLTDCFCSQGSFYCHVPQLRSSESD